MVAAIASRRFPVERRFIEDIEYFLSELGKPHHRSYVEKLVQDLGRGGYRIQTLLELLDFDQEPSPSGLSEEPA